MNEGWAPNADYGTAIIGQMTSATMRVNGLCSYVDSILNQSIAFDMMAIGGADVDPCISGYLKDSMRHCICNAGQL